MTTAITNTTILVVEDDEVIALDIKYRLEDMGYIVPVTASSGEDAIAFAEKYKPDLVFMDIILKGKMDGTSAAQIINKQLKIPIIFLTAFSDDDTLSRAKLSSPYGYITKPFETRSLKNAIEIALFKHSIDIKIIAAEQRYHAVMEHATCGIVIINLNQQIIDLNIHAENILGVTKEKALGVDFSDFISPSERNYAALQIKKVLVEKVTGPNNGNIVQPGGNICEVEFSAVYIDNEKDHFIFGILNDVTERNKLRIQTKLSDKLAMIGTISAGVIHEINNPMSYILSNLHYIDDKIKSVNEKDVNLLSIFHSIAEAVNESIQGAVKVGEIIHNLKGFARVDQQELAVVDLNEVLDAVIKMAHPEYKNKATLETDFDSKLPQLLSSKSKLHQVFLNLIINASQAMNANDYNSNKIIIRTFKDIDCIHIDITDTGKGMSAEIASKIFEPFFTTKEGGTGLGLSICYDIIHELGGSIIVKSELNKGTVFSINLPVSLIADKDIPLSLESKKIIRKNIFIIDDESTVLMVLEKMLGTENHVTKALGGRAAFYMLEKNSINYDVIICDLNMPDINGVDLYQYIQEHIPGMAEKFVFITGDTYIPSMKYFIANIKNPCLEKPFTMEQLTQAMNAVLGARA